MSDKIGQLKLKILEYKEWRKFEDVINKAKNACENANFIINNHFVGTDKMVDIGSNTKRKTNDYKLTRYACYLILKMVIREKKKLH